MLVTCTVTSGGVLTKKEAEKKQKTLTAATQPKCTCNKGIQETAKAQSYGSQIGTTSRETMLSHHDLEQPHSLVWATVQKQEKGWTHDKPHSHMTS